MTVACDDNGIDKRCVLIEEACGFWANVFASLVNKLGLGGSYVSCPLKYFNCTNNIKTSLITSGFYSGQKNQDGKPVDKPDQSTFTKCSHGGILDGSSFIKAEGGINKDSGYYLFSPHAMLHLKAAELAIKHTRKFFEDIRIKYGDEKFEKFLKLSVDNATLNSVGDVPCSSQTIKTNNWFIMFIFLNFLLLPLFC